MTLSEERKHERNQYGCNEWGFRSRRGIGFCRWGHAGYVKLAEDGTLDLTGHNVGLHPLKNGKRSPYCRACHRARESKRQLFLRSFGKRHENLNLATDVGPENAVDGVR